MSTSDEHFQSGGGNIYCNGNLTLSAGTIEGDVRALGNLTIDLTSGSELRIYGDIVCQQLVIIGETNRLILGNESAVYCDYITGQLPSSSAGYLYSVDDYLTTHPEGIYPGSMTRENILGINSSGEIIPEVAETKLIVNLEELRNEAGIDSMTGEFADFYTCYPKGIPGQTPSNTFGQDWINGTTDAVYIPSDTNLSGNIEITPTCSDFWIVLGDDGQTMAPHDQFNLIIDDSVYNVNILIRGDVQLNLNSAIISKTLFERRDGTTSIRYIDQNTDRININIYASGDIYNGCDSKLTLTNASMITGNAIAPNLEINDSGVGWRVSELRTKNGEAITNINGVDWIGNGLFRAISPYNSFGGYNYGWLSLLQLDPAETSTMGYLS